ncbi:MAG: hypothetical protein ACI4MP_01730 [Candidatus Ventricola sp.]
MHDRILILNYSDEFSMEIARRLRAEQIYAQIAAPDTTAAQVEALAPRGVILSGEALGKDAQLDEGILRLGIPVLALGHAAHLLLGSLGGASADPAIIEKKALVQYGASALFAGVREGERYIRQAHTLMLPTGVTETASAAGCAIAFEDTEKKQYGVQFELERNDPEGTTILMNFARDICGCSAWWTIDAAREQAEAALSRAAAQGGHAICAVSGGVDSTLAALLAHRAFGDRMTAIFMDTGLMREGEAEEIQATFDALGIPLLIVDRSGEILERLAHKRGSDEKRLVVTDRLYEEMLQQSASIEGKKTLVLGTNYSDFLHSGSSAPRWNESGMTVVEPLMELLKEEVRDIARMLGISESVVERKPFPSLGLGARIVGEVTGERLHALRTSEAIFREEIRLAGLERKLYKHFPVLIGGETVGSELLVLRAVTLSGGQLVPARLPYDLIERTVQRIMEATPSVSRVFYDETPTQVGRELFS